MNIVEILPKISDIGDFKVRRFLPSAVKRSVGPFIFFDEMGPVELAVGQGMDVRAHPHIGLATLTWLLEGEIVHRDSLGVTQVIRPGEINWMTAGKGIVHSERSTDHARQMVSKLYGLQIWMALANDKHEVDPDFQHYSADQLPKLERDGVKITVIAGTAWGLTSPVSIQLPTLYADICIEAGSELKIPSDQPERALYLLQGDIRVDGTEAKAGQFLILPERTSVNIQANSEARLVLLGGEPLTTRRRMWWNFVALDKERIEKAKDDWRNGRFPPVPGENDPLPLPE
jgi:redox-sensitive bicupin YhaK (pirin superfamily)